MTKLLENSHASSSLYQSSSLIAYMISSWWYLTFILSAYLALVLKIGPSLMKKRPPFQLKFVITVYNISQVILCTYLIKRVWNFISWSTLDFTVCRLFVENSEDTHTFKDICEWTFIVKHFELVDTVLFVLRKKQNQVSALHVFHHASIVIIAAFISNSYPAQALLFPIFLNSIIHIIMYTYYFLAGICSSEFMKRLLFIKKSVTTLQMIQFVIIILHASLHGATCGTPLYILVIFVGVVGIIFYGFWNFYKKTYHSIDNQKRTVKKVR